MATQQLVTADMLKLSDAERAQTIQGFVSARPTSPNGAVKAIDSEIAALEVFHGMDSSTLIELLNAKKVRETESFCHWLMLLDRRGRLVSADLR